MISLYSALQEYIHTLPPIKMEPDRDLFLDNGLSIRFHVLWLEGIYIYIHTYKYIHNMCMYVYIYMYELQQLLVVWLNSQVFPPRLF